MSESLFQSYVWPIITLIVGAIITISAAYFHSRAQKNILKINFSHRFFERRIEAINETVHLLNNMIISLSIEKDPNKLYEDLFKASAAMADKYHLLPQDLVSKADEIIDIINKYANLPKDKKADFGKIGIKIREFRRLIADYVEGHLS